MSYILALDQGTTSSRAILFNAAGEVVCTAQVEFEQIFPDLGWVEHDANTIWSSQLEVMREVVDTALQQHAISLQAIAAIAITNQRETTVLWDRKTGQPIANAIVWQDRRTVDFCHDLRDAGHGPLVAQKTGLVVDSYFSATKIRWLLDNVEGARAQAERGELAFGTIDTWLVWQLTQGRVHATDPSNASRTMLLNLETLDWDAVLLDLFDIPRSLLPDIVPSSGILGHTDASLLGRSLPIASLIGDQQAATFGQACFKLGMAKNTYGTGCFMLMNTGNQAYASQHRLLTTIGWQRHARGPATYCLEGSVFMGGATIQWLRDGLGLIAHASEVEALAQTVSDSGDTYLVPAFTGLGAPDWDGNARGTLVGITRGTTKAHIDRASLESIALQVAGVLDAMQKDSGIALTELRADGGACHNNLLMQMQADFTGVAVVRPKVTETTALGAAYLAGLATGVWSDTDQISSLWAIDRIFEPKMDEQARLHKIARWREAVERSLGWAKN